MTAPEPPVDDLLADALELQRLVGRLVDKLQGGKRLPPDDHLTVAEAALAAGRTPGAIRRLYRKRPDIGTFNARTRVILISRCAPGTVRCRRVFGARRQAQ